MNELIKFNLEIIIPKRWFTKFLQMLNCLRWCGKVGASRTVTFYADGDGDFKHFDFKVDGQEIEEINWEIFDKNWNPKNDKEIPPQFKTKRTNIDFFFNAG